MFLLGILAQYALSLVLLLLFFAVVVEGATELICKSVFFIPFRNVVSRVHPTLEELVRCGYCTSMWVAMLPAFSLAYILSPSWAWWLVFFVPLTVFIHRMSNRLHDWGDKHLDKFYDKRFKKDK